MTVTETQNRIIKQVLNIENLDILKDIERLLNDTPQHYTTEGKALTNQEYKQAIDRAIKEECTDSKEVFKNIRNAYNLD